jgi:hypothetical protein
VVQHLQVLEASGLVRSEKVGRVRTCRIERAALRSAERWIERRRLGWERRIDRLGVFLCGGGRSHVRKRRRMMERSIERGSFTLTRRYAAPPGRVFAAWADPTAKARWFSGPDEWRSALHELDLRVGGIEPPNRREEGTGSLLEALAGELQGQATN